jgi:hypothetical protein
MMLQNHRIVTAIQRLRLIVHVPPDRQNRKPATSSNYGERYRAGERISSCLAESSVNAVISKRFAKRQQMQWTKRGAHLLLQTRTRTLDGTLRSLFEEWYPGLANDNSEDPAQAEAA